MADAVVKFEERTREDGVVLPVVVADLYTRQEDVRIEILPDHDEPDFFRAEDVGDNKPSHQVNVLARTGRMIFSGRGWTKNDGKGPKLSVNMSDPRLSFNVWKEAKSDEWRITGGGFS